MRRAPLVPPPTFLPPRGTIAFACVAGAVGVVGPGALPARLDGEQGQERSDDDTALLGVRDAGSD
jgi:hypothetical protein